MVLCMSRIVIGCIVWCPSAFTSLLGLESFPLGSNGLFHMLFPPPGFTTSPVGPSCATHLLSCLEQASLDAVADIFSGSISYTCRRTHMQVEDLLEMIACLRGFKLSNFKTRGEIALGFCWHISPHVTYKKVMLQGYFLTRDHFYICDICDMVLRKGWSLSAWLHFPTCMWWDGCYVSWNMFLIRRSNARAYSRVLSPSTSGSSLPSPIPPCPSLYPIPARPSWLFQSPQGSEIGILAVTARSWSKNRSLTLSLRPLLGAYTDRKVTTRWPTISFTKMILSQTLLHQQCLFCFRTCRACTWCPCPWLWGSCHHGIWSPEYNRHLLPCGIVFPLPRKLFLRVFILGVLTLNFLRCLLDSPNGPTLPPALDRRPSWRRYQQNFDVRWHHLTQILLLR